MSGSNLLSSVMEISIQRVVPWDDPGGKVIERDVTEV